MTIIITTYKTVIMTTWWALNHPHQRWWFMKLWSPQPWNRTVHSDTFHRNEESCLRGVHWLIKCYLSWGFDAFDEGKEHEGPGRKKASHQPPAEVIAAFCDGVWHAKNIMSAKTGQLLINFILFSNIIILFIYLYIILFNNMYINIFIFIFNTIKDVSF